MEFDQELNDAFFFLFRWHYIDECEHKTLYVRSRNEFFLNFARIECWSLRCECFVSVRDSAFVNKNEMNEEIYGTKYENHLFKRRKKK